MFRFSAIPQSLGEVLTDALKLYRSTLLGVLPISAMIMLIGSLPSIMQLITGQPVAVATSGMQPRIPGMPATGFDVSRISDILMAGVEILITPLLIAILVHAMYALARGQRHSLMQSLRVISGKLPAIFCAFILSTLLILAGFMLFVLPGVFASIMFMFCIPLVVLDDLGGILALERSWKLVWRHWWVTFAVLLPPMFISILVMGLMLVIARHNQILFTILNAVAMSLITPLFYSVMLVQFNNLKLRLLMKSALEAK